MASTEFPRRGEVWLVALGAGRTGEPGKTRPAVVVSTDDLTPTSTDLIVIVPLSSSAAPSPLRVEIDPGTAGIDRPSRAVARAVRAVAATRLLQRTGEVAHAQMRQIEAALALILELRSPLPPSVP